MTPEKIKYFYAVKISNIEEVFKDEKFSKIFPHGNEAIIKSKFFSDHRECTETICALMKNLSGIISYSTDQSYVLVSKTNPKFLLTDNDQEIASSEEWGETTIVRLFLANSETLKKSAVLDYSVFGEIHLVNENTESLPSN